MLEIESQPLSHLLSLLQSPQPRGKQVASISLPVGSLSAKLQRISKHQSRFTSTLFYIERTVSKCCVQDLGSRKYRVIVDRCGGRFRLCSSRDGNRSNSNDEVEDVDELHFQEKIVF